MINFYSQTSMTEIKLRYGENPHQQASFEGKLEDIFEQLNGEDISYNNLQDIAAGLDTVKDIGSKNPTCVVVKHINACGIAIDTNPTEALRKAIECDPESAFGGVIVLNDKVDLETAKVLVEDKKLFFQVLVASDFENAALDLIMSKGKNAIILKQKSNPIVLQEEKTILGGKLKQEKDNKHINTEDIRPVTSLEPTDSEKANMAFAMNCVKGLKSNAIAIVKNGMMIGMGCGQTSRIKALEIAIEKAKKFGHDLSGSVLGSDAFFPFADGVELADKNGIKNIVQPGGSIRDPKVIDYCNQNNIKMAFTGIRHFKH